MKRFVCVVSVLFICCIVFAAVRLSGPGAIHNMAGTPGKRGYSGDKEDALYARLSNPMGIALDRWNNIYIADTRNHRVRRIDVRSGDIDTVAGTGKPGFTNDGGSGEQASLNGPTALAFDKIGNLYIADTGNQRIRLLDIRGHLHTVAGNGRRGYEGEGSRALVSALNNPTGIAISRAGELYIADTGNNRIRKVDRTTGILKTVAGDGERRDNGDWGRAVAISLNRPTAIMFDKHDNLYIADTGNHKIRFVDHQNERILTLGGNGRAGYEGDNSGFASDASFNEPTGLALDRFGRVYVADTGNQRIRRITVDLHNQRTGVETVAGTGKRGYNGSDINAWDAQLAYPGALAINPYDMLYFVDTGNQLVRRVEGVSLIRAPSSYTSFVQAPKETDSRSFYEVLFKQEAKEGAA